MITTHPDDVVSVIGSAYQVSRRGGLVYVLLETDRGPLRLCFAPADAHFFGGALRVHAVKPVGERKQETGDRRQETASPILKPGGDIL